MPKCGGATGPPTISPTAWPVRSRWWRDMHWSVSVTGVGDVIHEVATPTEEVRVVLEVPSAAVDELFVVIQSEAIADTGELVQAVQHLRALPGCRAISTPQHSGRKLMNRTHEPLAVAVVADPVIRLLDGWHSPIVARWHQRGTRLLSSADHHREDRASTARCAGNCWTSGAVHRPGRCAGRGLDAKGTNPWAPARYLPSGPSSRWSRRKCPSAVRTVDGWSAAPSFISQFQNRPHLTDKLRRN